MDDQTKSTDSQRSNKDAVVFAVTSGKGGVGKTSISVSMATEFASRGFRTILVDTDLGLANTHILAGLKPPKRRKGALSSLGQFSTHLLLFVKCPCERRLSTASCPGSFPTRSEGSLSVISAIQGLRLNTKSAELGKRSG